MSHAQDTVVLGFEVSGAWTAEEWAGALRNLAQAYNIVYALSHGLTLPVLTSTKVWFDKNLARQIRPDHRLRLEGGAVPGHVRLSGARRIGEYLDTLLRLRSEDRRLVLDGKSITVPNLYVQLHLFQPDGTEQMLERLAALSADITGGPHPPAAVRRAFDQLLRKLDHAHQLHSEGRLRYLGELP